MEVKTMNKYQVQIENFANGNWDWLIIYADTDEEALHKASSVLYNYQNPRFTFNYKDAQKNQYYKEKYTGYSVSCIISVENNCNPPLNHNIISKTTKAENNTMTYFNVNWNDYINEISELAAKEEWSSATYPDKKILSNYMEHTYRKLSSEKNIIINKDYALFNTGLFTEFYQPIYAYNDKNGLQFLTAYELGNMNISERPPRANYFEDPSLLLFDWHYEININYKHILKDINNLDRIPGKLKDSKNILNNLNGSIETMKKKVSANYKLAIPQYYEGKIQLLLPLCLEDDETPSLALTVTRIGNYYQGHTCLTLDMAYNNARLIVKPESNWLSGQ